MATYRETLQREFSAQPGTFLSKLRPGFEWDQEAFSRLLEAMQTCCEEQERTPELERWLAEGFWYVSWYVKQWTTHERFPRPYPQEYYDKAYQRLLLLASWFFTGESPWLPGTKLEPL